MSVGYSFCISQGSVATHLKCGGNFYTGPNLAGGRPGAQF